MKKLLFFILLINLHVSAQDAWNCLVENEKEIIKKLLAANYGVDELHIDTSGLVENAHWINDSTAHIGIMNLCVGNLDIPEILPRPLTKTIDELGTLKYLQLLKLEDNQITHLWNTIEKNDNLEKIYDAPFLRTLPKTISGCEKLTNIELGRDLEYLPDEFLDLHLFPFTDWENIHSRRGEIDLCDCNENKLTFTEKQKEWADVQDFTEYKKRFCDSLSDSAIVAELFRRNGYKNIDVNKAFSYYPNSNRIDSVIIRGEDFPEIKRLNFWVDFKPISMLKYIEISGIDTLNLKRDNLFHVRWTSEGEDTVIIDSLREIKINNIKNYYIYDTTFVDHHQVLNRKYFKKYSLRNCNLKSQFLPPFHKYTKADPKKIDLCGNENIVFDGWMPKSWFQEYGYDIETYEDYERYFCNNDVIEPTQSTTTDFNVSFANKQLQITLSQSMKIEKMKLLTVDGKIIKQFSVPTGTVMPSQFTLELNDTLSAGFYILSLDVGGKQFQKKFVVR